MSFPIAGESVRGVVFTDFGTVERNSRSVHSAPVSGPEFEYPAVLRANALALDFAIPLTKDSEDDVQIISFSFGLRNKKLCLPIRSRLG